MKQKLKNPYRVDSVNVISTGEQVSYVETPSGCYLIGSIPDASCDSVDPSNVIARVSDHQEAVKKFNELYGIESGEFLAEMADRHAEYDSALERVRERRDRRSGQDRYRDREVAQRYIRRFGGER